MLVLFKFITNNFFFKKRLNNGQLNFNVKYVMGCHEATNFKSRCCENAFDAVVVVLKRHSHHLLKTEEV